MSDFIRREDVIQEFVKTCSIEHVDINSVAIFYETIMKIINSVPSTEQPERTAKVETVEKPNVFKCSECGQYFHSTAWGSPVKYCSRCGCRLIWGEDIPMEYFESGGR